MMEQGRGEKGAGKKATGPHTFSMEGWVSCAPFERLLNMKIVEAAEGRAILTMPFVLDLAQGAGLMHGGALVSLADTAVVMAIKSLLPPKTHFGTISLKASFLRPVKEGVVRAEAHILRSEGRELEGEATVYDGSKQPVLTFASVFRVARDAEVRGVVFQGC